MTEENATRAAGSSAPACSRCPVTDPVRMWAVRMIGRNVPHTCPTYYRPEAESWLVAGAEIVRVTIEPDTPPCSAPVPDWVAEEINATWRAARDAGGEMAAFRIIERMVDRLGYGRTENNPSCVPNVLVSGGTPSA